MTNKFPKALLAVSIAIFYSCASVPPQTVLLSKQLGRDLETVQQSHINIIELHFNDIKNNINAFIDETYSPFIIHYVLEKEYTSYKSGKTSLFLSLEKAATEESQPKTEQAVNDMQDFLMAAKRQIEKKRKELMDPVLSQEKDLLNAVNSSYRNMANANNAITNYLQSVRNIKKSQSEVLNEVGLSGADKMLTENLSKLSNKINSLVMEGRKIDSNSEDAFDKIKNISDEMKNIIQKK